MKNLMVLTGLLAFTLVQADQSEWWPKVESFEKEYLSFIDQLLAVGLPDPRGGHFRKVTVKELDVTQGISIEVVAYGWVKPGSTKVAAINGLEYDIEKDLAPAETWTLINSSSPEYRHPNEQMFRLQTPGSLFYSMLIVSGKPEQALQKNFRPQDMMSDLFDVARFRCLASFKIGDYTKANSQYFALRTLAKLAEERSLFERREAWPVIQTLESVEKLGREIDKRQRRSESLRNSPTPESTKDIKSAIEGLQEARIAYRSYAFKKWEEFEAVLSHGPLAVPDLIDAYEQNSGLTRIFLQDFNYLPTGMDTVSNQAWLLILTLWPQASYLTSYNSLPHPADLRIHWEKAKGLSQTERFIAILSDPTLNASSYEYAFRNFQFSLVNQKSTDEAKQAAKEDALALLKRRVHQIFNQAKQGEQASSQGVVAAVRMMRLYNSASSKPDLKFLVSATEQLMSSMENNIKAGRQIDSESQAYASILLHDRQSLGEQESANHITRLNDLTAVNLLLNSSSIDLLSLSFLEPGFFSLLTKVENILKSGASRDLQKSLDLISNLVSSQCLKTQILRQSLVRLLSLDAALYNGQFSNSGSGAYVYLKSYQTDRFNQSFYVPRRDAFAGISLDLSAGDVIALYLQGIKGAPPFDPTLDPKSKALQKEATISWLLDGSGIWKNEIVGIESIRHLSNSFLEQLKKPT